MAKSYTTTIVTTTSNVYLAAASTRSALTSSTATPSATETWTVETPLLVVLKVTAHMRLYARGIRSKETHVIMIVSA